MTAPTSGPDRTHVYTSRHLERDSAGSAARGRPLRGRVRAPGSAGSLDRPRGSPVVVIESGGRLRRRGPGVGGCTRSRWRLYTDPETRLDHAFIGWWEDPDHGWMHAYDALHDRGGLAGWRRSTGPPASRAATSTTRAGCASTGCRATTRHGDALRRCSPASSRTPRSPSATTLAMKVFRKITPGEPDISVHEVLTSAGRRAHRVPHGWPDSGDGDPGQRGDEGTGTTMQMAMLQQFLRTASDGWDLAPGERPQPLRRATPRLRGRRRLRRGE